MDVNEAAVTARRVTSRLFIHGHTHLPNDHGKRLVLGAWPDDGAILQLNANQEISGRQHQATILLRRPRKWLAMGSGLMG